MTLTKTEFENVVCDLHLADMRAMQVLQGTDLIDGFGKCPVGGCTRFFGNGGYCEIIDEGAFARVRTEPTCSKRHEPQPMYLQRTPDCIRWICPLCYSVAPHHPGMIKP